MRNHSLSYAALAVAFSSIAACSGGSSPVGVWRIDVDAMKTVIESMMQEQMKDVPAAQQGMMKQVMANMIEGLSKSNGSIEFTADGVATMHEDQPDGSHQHTKGTWKLEGDKVALTAVPPGKQAQETKYGTLSGNELRIEEDANGRKISIVFRRK